MSDKAERIKYLTGILNEASKAYYMQDTEIMTNYEYDALYDELKALEEETGIVLSGSPTIRVGYEVLSELPKEEHEFPMLSLDKTKETQTLVSWLDGQKAVLSWKMDGLTVVLKYVGGELYKAVTRGNGYVGEVITGNARVFKNVPQKISYKGELTLRGEAVIRYSDFNRINASLPEGEAKYKNPRNLCSGSVRQLNNKITEERSVYFYAFALVNAPGQDFENSVMHQFAWLKAQGFDVVEHELVDPASITDTVLAFSEKIAANDFPSDGLVISLEDIAYGESLGRTAKFPRNAIAFKWADETAATKLIDVEWSPSRTGLINPVAIFEPVELEGTTVSRASVHNVSILRALELGIGDEITVFKANMIIPQIAENLTRSNHLALPEFCPVCHGKTEVREIGKVASLYCSNPDCQAKHVGAFAHFVGRDAFNMEGLSEATLEKCILSGWIHEFADLFHMEDHHDAFVEMDGFGEKSYAKMIQAIDKARKITPAKLIFSLGIPNVGLSTAGLICKAYDHDIEAIVNADAERLTQIDGIGKVIADSFIGWFADAGNKERFERLLQELVLDLPEKKSERALSFEGLTFVITGSVEHFKNRNELKAVIEALGGKVAGSVSAKTSYLINNDAQSASSKNKKARELGVAIITEEAFMQMANLSF